MLHRASTYTHSLLAPQPENKQVLNKMSYSSVSSSRTPSSEYNQQQEEDVPAHEEEPSFSLEQWRALSQVSAQSDHSAKSWKAYADACTEYSKCISELTRCNTNLFSEYVNVLSALEQLKQQKKSPEEKSLIPESSDSILQRRTMEQAMREHLPVKVVPLTKVDFWWTYKVTTAGGKQPTFSYLEDLPQMQGNENGGDDYLRRLLTKIMMHCFAFCHNTGYCKQQQQTPDNKKKAKGKGGGSKNSSSHAAMYKEFVRRYNAWLSGRKHSSGEGRKKEWNMDDIVKAAVAISDGTLQVSMCPVLCMQFERCLCELTCVCVLGERVQETSKGVYFCIQCYMVARSRCTLHLIN